MRSPLLQFNIRLAFIVMTHVVTELARATRLLCAVWFTKCNVNDNGNDSHSNISGNKFE
jgi:hypothetical protein